MRLLITSARRVWTKRPAGPVLIALGITIATLLAASTSLALTSATKAQEADDVEAIGDVLARAWTPGGFTLGTPALDELAAELDQASEQPRELAVFLERDALVTRGGQTEANWRVLGLATDTLQALGLPIPPDGNALVHPPDGSPTGTGPIEVRVQTPPETDVRLPEDHLGQLVRTVRVGDTYVHDDQDEYIFTVDVEPGAKALELFLDTADDDTDFDLEATDPTGTTRLDDAGTAAQPVPPRIEVEDPAPGNWTVQVHAKLADNVAFRLQAVQVFDASDAQTLGRLLEGRGFRAVGALLGLTSQARIDLQAEPTDLSVLGPGNEGLVVLPMERLQQAMGLEDQATGVLILAASDEDPLTGIPGQRLDAFEQAVATARSQAEDRFDPLQGLTLDHEAGQAQAERIERIESTERLLFVVLPSGVFAGVLLATWAAGLHTRRLQGELQVLAGMGQPRSRSWLLVILHLGPPFLLGTLAALLLSPLLGTAIARGIGLDTTSVLVPSASALLVPLAAMVPIGAIAYLTLRHAVEGEDPRHSGLPPSRRSRSLVSVLWLGVLALVAGAWILGEPSPTTRYLLGALAACAAGLALLWAPLIEPLLSRPGLVRVGALGLFRTRSSHAYLALAAATATLVLAALLSGIALSQAATPDATIESGGYAVIATTPTFTESLEELDPDGQAASLFGQTQGTEFMMRVTGLGIHSAPTSGVQTVYGIDTSFAQRHQHLVTPLPGASSDPVGDVARSDELALVSRSVHDAMDSDTIRIEGPQGQLAYEVVGVIETRLLDGVYVSKDALPSHFTQLAGEQRILLPGDVDAEAFAGQLTEAFKDDGLSARSSQAMVADQLEGQLRAGTTLQALAALGVVTALLLVLLLGLRAQAERRLSDAVFVAMGANRRSIAFGIATETLLPLIVGLLIGGAVLLPLAGELDAIEGLAFPLLPIDGAGLLQATLVTLAGVLILALAVSTFVGYRAVRGLDQRVLRELG